MIKFARQSRKVETLPVEEKYTKQELQLHKNAVAAIASAVLQQWKADGCPENDYSIKIWKGVLRNAIRSSD